ncbi:MAG: hypothetical protein AVDCRST_MAG02-144 [uncultured Rubrobacteraceae bacterium]|uniref:Uncharacterized protein n=1 Tax=uncultured Rubrobacteraceae bacterium TaxID=349277 RepID=A0A6J4QJQ4_9ACTN|nr:MAG: hypothetical protein AVDCRST_MAG02-144 [uncultured Rubrobacteraceae bacterium]
MAAQRPGGIIGFVKLKEHEAQEANKMAKFTQMSPARTSARDGSNSGGSNSGGGNRRRRRRRRRNT